MIVSNVVCVYQVKKNGFAFIRVHLWLKKAPFKKREQSVYTGENFVPMS